MEIKNRNQSLEEKSLPLQFLRLQGLSVALQISFKFLDLEKNKPHAVKI